MHKYRRYSRPTSYSVVSVYLLNRLGCKVCTHEEVPFLIDYTGRLKPRNPINHREIAYNLDKYFSTLHSYLSVYHAIINVIRSGGYHVQAIPSATVLPGRTQCR